VAFSNVLTFRNEARRPSLRHASGLTAVDFRLYVASHSSTKLSTGRDLARRADLLPNYLSQRLIDPVLPARSGFLKVIKNVPVNSQRDKLLGIRDGRTFRREFRGLRGCRLERCFSRIP
jgi:hypothetical protein